MEFQSYPKIPRYQRDIIITEKLDGTNGQIYIVQTGELTEPDKNCLYRYETGLAGIALDVYAGSRNRWLSTKDDNYGFAKWVLNNIEELLKLGPGRHFGEWWGLGINRDYNMSDKVFSLFNTARWNEDNIPSCCQVVPVLYEGPWNIPLKENKLDEERCKVHPYFSADAEYLKFTDAISYTMQQLHYNGSIATPHSFYNPEGIVIFHKAGNVLFKKTFHNDEKPGKS